MMKDLLIWGESSDDMDGNEGEIVDACKTDILTNLHNPTLPTCSCNSHMLSIDEEKATIRGNDQHEESAEQINSDHWRTGSIVIWDVVLVCMNPHTLCLFRVRPLPFFTVYILPLLQHFIFSKRVTCVATVIHIVI